MGTGTMSSREAATYIGVSYQTLRKWNAQGGVPGGGLPPRSIKVGGARRYLEDDLRAWLDEHADRPAASA